MDVDENFVQLYTNPQGTADIKLKTLYHWQQNSALVKELSLKQEAAEGVLSDDKVVRSISKEIKQFSNLSFLDSKTNNDKQYHRSNYPGPKKHFTIVETIGGPLSPGPSHTLQADIYRPLRLPVLLVGDSRLGGITATLSAYESLALRGRCIFILYMKHISLLNFGDIYANI